MNLDRGNETTVLHTDKKITLKWDGVAGMRQLKAIFERDVILPFQFPELYKKYRVPIPNGILLYGPPGCGKTFIARALAKELGYNFIEVKPSDLASIYVHGTQEKIGGLFRKAKEEAPTLLFFDEFDAFVPKRGDVSHHYGSEVNEFLVHLNESAQNKILVVGATNILKNVDDAIKRPGRLDKKIFVGTPDFEARIEALKLFMRDRPQDNIDWLYVAENCEYYTYAELENVVNESAREALEKRVSISTTLIMRAMENNLPAHDKEKIESIYNSR